jgi:hypothetical protein
MVSASPQLNCICGSIQIFRHPSQIVPNPQGSAIVGSWARTGAKRRARGAPISEDAGWAGGAAQRGTEPWTGVGAARKLASPIFLR